MVLKYTIASLFYFNNLSCDERYHRFCTKLGHTTCRDNNIDSATRIQHIESLILHSITDKEAYLSESTKLHFLLLPLLLVSSCNQ